MITKYLVTDCKGKEIYLETFDESEAVKHWQDRKKAMDCYLGEEEISYEEVQYMSDEERIRMYEQITGDKLDKVDEEFWDWVEEEI